MIKRINKTGPVNMKQGDLVLNKTQQSRIKRAKTPVTIRRVVKKVMKQDPKPMSLPRPRRPVGAIVLSPRSRRRGRFKSDLYKHRYKIA